MNAHRLVPVVEGPAPVVHPDVAPFWDAVAAGGFVLPRCRDCGYLRFPVVAVCPRCLSTRTDWEPASRVGTVAAATLVARVARGSAWAAATPFLTGLVDLEVGVRVPGRILCDCGIAAEPGTAVRIARVAAADARTAYAFVHDCRTEES